VNEWSRWLMPICPRAERDQEALVPSFCWKRALAPFSLQLAEVFAGKARNHHLDLPRDRRTISVNRALLCARAQALPPVSAIQVSG